MSNLSPPRISSNFPVIFSRILKNFLYIVQNQLNFFLNYLKILFKFFFGEISLQAQTFLLPAGSLKMAMYLLGGMFLLLGGIWARASPTLPAQEGRLTDCPTCSIPKLPSDPVGADNQLVEAVKRHILNMLHLKNRPNITQTIPKAALLNALKKLHVGRVGEDGRVEIEEHSSEQSAPREPEQASEIISFAEAGEINCTPTRFYSDLRNMTCN